MEQDQEKIWDKQLKEFLKYRPPDKNKKQTFLDVIRKYNKSLSYKENLFSKVLVWSADYEKCWYLIHDEVPDAAAYFWANRFGTYLYKFERFGKKWKMVEKGKFLTIEDISRITNGPAFKEVPPVFDYHKAPNELF